MEVGRGTILCHTEKGISSIELKKSSPPYYFSNIHDVSKNQNKMDNTQKVPI